MDNVLDLFVKLGNYLIVASSQKGYIIW